MYQTSGAFSSVALALISSCGYQPPQFGAETVVVRGYYYAGELEMSEMIDVGLPDGAICLSGRPDGLSDPVFRYLHQSSVRASQRQFVIVEGRLSRPGHYGHLGECGQVLQLSRLVQARTATPAELESLGIAWEAEEKLDQNVRSQFAQ